MARNQETNQKLKDERREQILSAALLLFASKGLAATKVSDIADAAGMSQGLMYHYFKAKEEIFIELIRSAFEKINFACSELERMPDPPQEKIRMALAALLQGIQENADHARYHLLIAQATASEAIPPEARAIIERENQLPYECIARIMQQGQREGSIRAHDTQELSLVFWSSIRGLAIYRALHGESYRSPDPELLMRVFLP
ncbi:MAG TPA: TetR/AcrR family transcriptional regulator [Anaerolineales bacterium]|nr:TetR/AcrR family transcriptional regulator [Anaerolineales bacterium]